VLALREQVAEQTGALEKARENELTMRRRERELESKEREMQLHVERALNEGRAKQRLELQEEVADEQRLRDLEQDKVIGDLKRTIDDLKRKAEQGSQQLQGEVQELDLESTLRRAFPRDDVEEVGKGVRGGDCIQRVRGPNGEVVGTILWESKRTKAWSNEWLAKLREDQREVRADVAILLTNVMPKNVDASFADVNGVWVTSFAGALPLTGVLRHTLSEVTRVRRAQDGVGSKMEVLYEYMSGPDFRRRVEAIIESFETMRADLVAEQRAIKKHWKKRETQLNRMLDSTTAMYGELQAIAGSAVGELDDLSFAALEARADDTDLDVD
ncbi:MAG: DUF2130 domain-containing protein, partial [Planctomycetota bacterium]